MTRTNISLSKEVAALIAADVANVERTAKSRFLVIDAMVAAGLKATDWISPKAKDSGSTATPELFASLKASVIMGFSPADRTLIAVESKAAVAALKPEKAARRTYVQQQIGSRMKDYKNALKRREEAPTDGAGGRKRPAPERFLDFMAKAVNVLREEGDFAFDVADMTTYLNKAVTMAKVSAPRK